MILIKASSVASRGKSDAVDIPVCMAVLYHITAAIATGILKFAARPANGARRDEKTIRRRICSGKGRTLCFRRQRPLLARAALKTSRGLAPLCRRCTAGRRFAEFRACAKARAETEKRPARTAGAAALYRRACPPGRIIPPPAEAVCRHRRSGRDVRERRQTRGVRRFPRPSERSGAQDGSGRISPRRRHRQRGREHL